MAIQHSTLKTQKDNALRIHIIKGATGSLTLQVGFAGIAFLNAIILSRVMGASGYGTFTNAMAWVNLLTIIATFGLGILLVRDVAIYQSQGKWGLLKGLLRFSNFFVFFLSMFLTLIAGTVSGLIFSLPDQMVMRHTIWIALLLLPLLSLYNLQASTMRGLERVVRANLPGMIVRPGLLLSGIVVIYFLCGDLLSAPLAMAVNVAAGLVALGMGILFLRKLLSKEVKTSTAVYAVRPWLKAAFPMLLYGGAQIILGQTDIVMLGIMKGSYEVGLYAAAGRLSYLLVYVIYASEVILAPIISRLYANSDRDKMQKIITQAIQISFFIVLPFGLLFILWGANILKLFGIEFVAAKLALIILTIGHLVEVALGSGALLLSMVGSEVVVAITFLLISFVNITLNFFLIPLYGLNGAAIASMISLIVAKLFFSIYAMKKLKLNTTVFGVPKIKKVV